jgi:hypothetical protein
MSASTSSGHALDRGDVVKGQQRTHALQQK